MPPGLEEARELQARNLSPGRQRRQHHPGGSQRQQGSQHPVFDTSTTSWRPPRAVSLRLRDPGPKTSRLGFMSARERLNSRADVRISVGIVATDRRWVAPAADAVCPRRPRTMADDVGAGIDGERAPTVVSAAAVTTAPGSCWLANPVVRDFQYDAAEYWGGRILIWVAILSLVAIAYTLTQVLRGRANGAAGKSLILASAVLLPSFSVADGYGAGVRPGRAGGVLRLVPRRDGPFVADMETPAAESRGPALRQSLHPRQPVLRVPHLLWPVRHRQGEDPWRVTGAEVLRRRVLASRSRCGSPTATPTASSATPSRRVAGRTVAHRRRR